MNTLINRFSLAEARRAEKFLDKDPGGRNSFVDETRTRVGKVDDNMAMVQLFDVDMPKMAKMMNDPNSPVKAIMEEHVLKQEIYTITKMAPPGS